ncbi:MAG: transcription termination factor Rho, partial [Flavobacterium sp.]
MFDISALKEMKLAELQEIAKLAKTIKITGVKKEALISQILAHQEATVSPPASVVPDAETVDDKPKRARIVPAKKAAVAKKTPVLEFDNAEETTEKTEAQAVVNETPKAEETKKETVAEKKGPKIVKFNKSAYEKKVAQQKEKEASKEIVAEPVPENNDAP